MVKSFARALTCCACLAVACGDDDGDSPADRDDAGLEDAATEPGGDGGAQDAGDSSGPPDDAGSMDAAMDAGPDAAADAGQDAGSGPRGVPPSDVSREVPDASPTTMTATQAGLGGLLTNTQQEMDEGDEVWSLGVDLDGDGTDEEVSVLYDEEARIQYTWWNDVIEGFCLDGSDAAAPSMLVYFADEDEELMLWESDCAEDQGVIFGCSVSAAGALSDCGTCSQEDDIWSCSPYQSFACQCDADCDSTPYELELALCDVTAEQSAMQVAQDACEAEFASDCSETACDCSCSQAADACE